MCDFWANRLRKQTDCGIFTWLRFHSGVTSCEEEYKVPEADETLFSSGKTFSSQILPNFAEFTAAEYVYSLIHQDRPNPQWDSKTKQNIPEIEANYLALVLRILSIATEFRNF